MKKIIIIFVFILFLTACNGGNSGGDGSGNNNSTSPTVTDFRIYTQAASAYTSQQCDWTYLSDRMIKFQFEISDSDLDAKILYYTAYREDDSIYYQGEIDLLPQESATQAYQSEYLKDPDNPNEFFIMGDDYTGLFTIESYAVDSEGLESSTFVFEGCVYHGFQP